MNALVAELSKGYMAAELCFILCLFLLGGLTAYAVGFELRECLVNAFPAGLAIYSAPAFLLLCLGIPFGKGIMLAIMGIWGIAALILGILRFRREGVVLHRREAVLIALCVVIVLSLALLSVSNILKVAVDNDSLYYFSNYPEAIVKEGRYLKNFDVLLTDAGPIGAVIHTAPYLFGFARSFGIQHAMNFSFLTAFFGALYHMIALYRSRKEAYATAGLATAFLATSTAFLTTAKWVMSGDYFMIYFCLLLFLMMPGTADPAGTLAGSGDGIVSEASDGSGFGSKVGRKPGHTAGAAVLLLPGLYALMCACIRQEGVIMLTIFVALVSATGCRKGRHLFLSLILPPLVCSSLYYIRVLAVLKVAPLYAFLTWKKALVITALMVALSLYLLFIRDRLEGKGLASLLLPGMPVLLIVANILLLIMDSGLYLANLKAFYGNIRQREGWGFFPYIILLFVLFLVIKAFMKKEKYISLYDSLMLSYLLTVPVVSFGRGDALRIGVGDSGNRILLTAVPLMVFAVVARYYGAGRPGCSTDAQH